MKQYIMMMCLVSSNAMALDFETEWAKFADSFAKLKARQSSSVAPVAVAEPASEIAIVDPKSPDRLGKHVSDPVLKEKMESLYKRDDVVVYSTTVR